jgi:uncharacterized membrane protein
MKLAKIVLILAFAACLINAIKGGDSYYLPQVLPFMAGKRPIIFEVLSLVLIVLALIILHFVSKRNRRSRYYRNERTRNPRDIYDNSSRSGYRQFYRRQDF